MTPSDPIASLQAEQAAVALRESEARFRTVVEEAPDAIFIQTHGRFAYVNAAALRLFGAARPEDLVGRSVEEHVHPDFRRQVAARIRMLNEQRQPVPPTDEVCLALDGTARPVNVSAVPFEYQQAQGALVFARDITDRKRTEAALRESEGLFRSIWEHSRDAMRLTDREGTVVLVNQAYCDLVERSRAEIEGHSLAEIYAPHQQDHVLESYRARFADRNFEAYSERTLALWNGREIWLGVTTALLDTGNGTPLVLTVFRDITERKRADQAVASHLRELQRWHDATLGREGRILQLKREVNALLQQAGQPPRYASVVAPVDPPGEQNRPSAVDP